MSYLLLNGAGGAASDPVLKGLGLEWVIAPVSMDVATLVDAWVDTGTGNQGQASVKAALSPAANVVISGSDGAYDDGTKQLSLHDTQGLSEGDYLYLAHPAITPGIYPIASIPGPGLVLLATNPFEGLGDQDGISYQNAWRYLGAAGAAPVQSDPGGALNVFNAVAQDSSGDEGSLECACFVADAPEGADFIALGGKAYTGKKTNLTALSLAVLSGWAHAGGITHVELADHSVQGRNDFTFGDASITEKALVDAQASGLKITSGDGPKYARLLLKSCAGGAVVVGVDIDLTLDTRGPVLAFFLNGR